jgi:hypothetical protein
MVTIPEKKVEIESLENPLIRERKELIRQREFLKVRLAEVIARLEQIDKEE